MRLHSGRIKSADKTRTIYEEKYNDGRTVYYLEERKSLPKVESLNKSNLKEHYEKLIKNEQVSRDPKTLYETKDEVIVTYSITNDKKSKGIKPGVYQAKDSLTRGLEFIEMHEFKDDSYIDLSGIHFQIEEEIDKFFNRKEDYRKLGLAWRRSCLMWGPQGTGKSALLRKVTNKYKNNSVIVFLPNTIGVDLIEVLQTIKLNKILILEEITENAQQDMGNLLRFLDGERNIEGVFTIATTNYPEKLPGNVVDRPSRIDKLYHVDNPGAEQRKVYLKKILDRDITEEELKLTKDFSIAHLKESALSSIFENRSLTDVIKDSDKRKRLVQKSFAKDKPIGFRSDEYDDL